MSSATSPTSPPPQGPPHPRHLPPFHEKSRLLHRQRHSDFLPPRPLHLPCRRIRGHIHPRPPLPRRQLPCQPLAARQGLARDRSAQRGHHRHQGQLCSLPRDAHGREGLPPRARLQPQPPRRDPTARRRQLQRDILLLLVVQV
ncbi:U-box domain-containing protein 30-like [Iris pallida]|uniref:U-box domain-containing protein 30-like n=1 Tax=Iris pallida TaxID=29817 RepID=A0AAX6IBP7_IRIPA|nr:U-box domain-containing protein 30-like [Iris pallida]